MLRTMLQMMEEQSAATLKQKRSAMATWFNEWAKDILKAFEPGRKVIYTSAYAFPMELLRAFDMALFDFELAIGIIGATDMLLPSLEAAERQGACREICSFHRASLGAYYQGLFPTPDLLLTTSYFCDGKVKTNEILSQLFHKDSVLLQVPSTITKESVRYVESQLRQIGRKLEEVTGQTLDEDRLRESVRSSNRARRSQQRMLDLLKHRPSPWGGRALVAYSINGQVFSGTPVHEKLHQEFITEMETRLDSGPLKEEKHRVFWFAWIPVHGTNLFEVLKQHQVSVPLCETFRIHWDEIDELHPFAGLALKCLQNPFVGSVSRRLTDLAAIKEAFALQGAIFFATPACRQANAAFRVISDDLAKFGLPVLLLDMDIGDPRGYSPEQTRTRLEAFVELLDQQ